MSTNEQEPVSVLEFAQSLQSLLVETFFFFGGGGGQVDLPDDGAQYN